MYLPFSRRQAVPELQLATDPNAATSPVDAIDVSEATTPLSSGAKTPNKTPKGSAKEKIDEAAPKEGKEGKQATPKAQATPKEGKDGKETPKGSVRVASAMQPICQGAQYLFSVFSPFFFFSFLFFFL
jgi:hypothetical protein